VVFVVVSCSSVNFFVGKILLASHRRGLGESSARPLRKLQASIVILSKLPSMSSLFRRSLAQSWARVNHHSPRTPITYRPLRMPYFARPLSSPPPPTMASKTQPPHITNLTTLSSSDAKWVELKKIEYTDQTGRERIWEVASRKTRGKAGVDAVAIGTIILHPSRAPSTILVLQYRPPVDAITVEWPAGLVDAMESPEEAAVRELREETGYTGRVVSVSPTIASDPGMTTANMQLVMVEVRLAEGEPEPEQHLDDGEHIQRVVVPLDELYERLVGYSKEGGMMVSAKLWHWAAGLYFARQVLPGM
jgi:ADP-ribose pyrophosphatase